MARKSLWLLTAVFAALFMVAVPSLAVAQVDGTDATKYQADDDWEGLLPFGELKSMTAFGDIAIMEFPRGLVLFVPREVGEQYAASVGNPEADITVSWKSDGLEIELTIRQQAAENEAKFFARAAKTVAAAKKAFPPDPPPAP